MIFISHTPSDTSAAERFATGLAGVFGRDQVVDDAWTSQPGAGVIEAIGANDGAARLFFLFVSKTSLEGDLSSLAWQNALFAATKSKLTVIPVRLDASPMPTAMQQALYIDAYSQGPDVALRQMVDLVNGANTTTPAVQFHNIRATVGGNATQARITISAEAYIEPASRFAIGLDNPRDTYELTSESDLMIAGGWHPAPTDAGFPTIHLVETPRAVSPGFPMVIVIKLKKPGPIGVRMIARAVTGPQDWQPIPVTEV